MIRAGKLNRRVKIERFTSADDGHGGQVRSWALLAWVRVDLRPVGGREGLQAGTLLASQGWRIEMRRRDVTTEDRIDMDGTRLNIRSVVDPDGKRARLLLLCDTGIAE